MLIEILNVNVMSFSPNLHSDLSGVWKCDRSQGLNSFSPHHNLVIYTRAAHKPLLKQTVCASNPAVHINLFQSLPLKKY